jgi:hypothetical protein
VKEDSTRHDCNFGRKVSSLPNDVRLNVPLPRTATSAVFGSAQLCANLHSAAQASARRHPTRNVADFEWLGAQRSSGYDRNDRSAGHVLLRSIECTNDDARFFIRSACYSTCIAMIGSPDRLHGSERVVKGRSLRVPTQSVSRSPHSPLHRDESDQHC